MKRILIIGAGFGGLGLGVRLKQAGIESFTIVESASRVGGTWRDNSYPGAACDLPSMAYSYSFDQKTNWSRKWAPQAEIQEHIEGMIERHALASHIRCGLEVKSATFDESCACWIVETTAGEKLVAEILVSAVGQLHHPLIPALPGLDTFSGDVFHSARWNHSCDLHGKNVAVIGSAASAIQLIPEVAKIAGHLRVFQRSANWVLRRGDRAYTKSEHWAFAHLPGLMRLYRAFIWSRNELVFYRVIRKSRFWSWVFAWMATRYMHRVIKDPALRERLVPDYAVGGKRVLVSDDFYPALTRTNVSVVTDPIQKITTNGIFTEDGTFHPADVLVLATGFKTNPFLAPIHITGLQKRRLHEDWNSGARAFYGMSLPGYPNFFVLYGPNTNLGHNSILMMLECQIEYVLQAVALLDQRHHAYMDLRKDAMMRFDTDLQASLAQTVWASSGASWYKDSAGRITNNWPYSTFWYWWKTRKLREADYNFVARHDARTSSRLVR